MANPADRGYKRGMKTQDALAVANWFIDRAVADGTPVDMLKLQRLVYLAHGWSLAVTGLPLLRQRPEAWDFGPVIPAIYRAFADAGRQPITRKATIAGPAASVFHRMAFRDAPAQQVVAPRVDDPDAVALLQRVWDVYRGFTGVQLSNLSHRPGGLPDGRGLERSERARAGFAEAFRVGKAVLLLTEGDVFAGQELRLIDLRHFEAELVGEALASAPVGRKSLDGAADVAERADRRSEHRPLRAKRGEIVEDG